MPWFPISQLESNAVAQKQMGDTLQKASDDYYKVAGRPFEQAEGDALVYHLAKALRLASFGPPLGILTAGLVAYRPAAMKSFKFPGWTPGEKFNPDKFFVLKGGVARAAWHVLRFNAYGVLGLLAGEVLMGSYAMTVANVGRLQDPRLKDVNETLKGLQKERMKEKGLPIEDRTEGRRGQETLEMARQRTRAQGAGTRGGGSAGDDMSPTGGSFREDFEGSGAEGGGDVGMLSDSQIQQLQQTEQRNEEAAYQASNAAAVPAQNASRSSPSPRQSQPQSASNNSGSAWERLRQQAGQQQSQSSSPQSSRGTQRDEDDAFGLGGSSSNDDRSRMRPAASPSQSPQNPASSSRSEAQREFDAQLDRERQGEGNGRW